MQQKPIFLSGLNGIRTIAALGVMISHINIGLNHYFSVKEYSLFGFDSNGQQKGWALGEHGVTMFFVLSGFLITFLLKKEFEKTQTINIKAFFMRRILRIWPLYYFYFFITIGALYIFYNEGLKFDYLYYIFFLANIPFIEGKVYHGLNHLWSIGVEEQFYLFWPFLFLYAKKNFMKIVVGLIIFQSLIRIFLWFKFPFTFIATLSAVNRFDCMMFGAAIALLYLQKSKLLNIFNNKPVQIAAWCILLMLFFNVFHFFNSIIEIFVIAIVTGVLIIGQINISNRIINLEQSLISYLGKLSFGIYVYHPLIILLLSYVLKTSKLNISEEITMILIYITVVFLTIAISHISYYHFEAKFLKLKHRFSIVESTNERQKNK